jgi:lipid-binding SYLF domain-containing protein
MKRIPARVSLVVVVIAASAVLSAQSDQAQRIRYATTVLDEIMAAPDQAIPSSVFDKAEAIAVFPSVIKGGFVLSAARGKGVISVRDRASNNWSLPAFLAVTGGGIGALIVAQ